MLNTPALPLCGATNPWSKSHSPSPTRPTPPDESVEVKISISTWLTGRCGSMFSLSLASAADGCRSDVHDSVLVVVGWYGVVREGAVTGGAGRDLRHVGVRGGDRRGPRRGRGLMLRAVRSKVANCRGGITRPVTHRGGGVPTRAVVMGRSEPLAGVVGRCTRLARPGSGADWACRRAFRDARVCCGWVGGQRRLSRSCHKRRETWWDGGRCAETISADQREGRDGLGRVTMVSR